MLNTKNKHARKMSNEIICKLIITYSGSLLFFYIKGLIFDELEFQNTLYVRLLMITCILNIMLSFYVLKNTKNMFFYKLMLFSSLLSIILLLAHISINFF